MNPIKIKQKPAHYTILQELLSGAQASGRTDRELKAAQAILQKVYLRVVKKAIEARTNPNSKPKSLELAYYEAHELEKLLRANRGLFRAGSYEYNAVLSIADELDQKLQ
ncbi:hypothetical protein QO206_03265 [Leeuwenhoekiella aequorea]|uniref:hypothetical protein n=1 Tax=Leeuwenhoekiella aequorea TaxID=283736 RepID=UPI00352C3ED6|tara:strand:+ start:9229 stop:9555 length:327 start_codon:yes stop_codon:yes gene_type:complete